MPSAPAEPRQSATTRGPRLLRLLVVFLVVHAGLAEGAGISGMPEVLGAPVKAELPRVLPATVVPAHATLSASTQSPASGATKSRSRSSRPRRRLVAATGLALGCGVAAWWTKERADRAYERYLVAAGPRRQSREFSRAERYDRASGTALLGMETGLLLATYWLFY